MDMTSAAIWYNSERLGLGREFTDELDATLNKVQGGPFRYPVLTRNMRRARLHRFPYSVYFIVDEMTIAVIACLHSSRSPSVWMGRG
jgi:hypothetical protein